MPTIFPIEGWGAVATGGSGHPDVHVTNTNDSGAGSLREALDGDDRNIVFDVGGTFTVIDDQLECTNHENITVDGFTAPSPVYITGDAGFGFFSCQNIIVRGIRFYNIGVLPSEVDSVQFFETIGYAISQCTFFNPTDGSVDQTCGCQYGTVQWCIIATGPNSGKQMLIGGTGSCPSLATEKITVHHNAFIGDVVTGQNGGTDRSPLVRAGGYSPVDMTVDVVNNIIHGWLRDNATKLEYPGRVNVRHNLYIPAQDTSRAHRENAIRYPDNPDTAFLTYTEGNLEVLGSAPPAQLNGIGRKSSAWYAPPITEQGAQPASVLIRDNAGIVPRDAVETALLARLDGIPSEGATPVFTAPKPQQSLPQTTSQGTVVQQPVTVAPCTPANFRWTKVLTTTRQAVGL